MIAIMYFVVPKHWNLAFLLESSFFWEWICACACQKIFWTTQMMVLFASLKMWLMQAIPFIAIISQITKKKNPTYFWGGVEAAKDTCELRYDRKRKSGSAKCFQFGILFCYTNTRKMKTWIQTLGILKMTFFGIL